MLRIHALVPFALAIVGSACTGFPDAVPQTNVVLENRYPTSTSFVIYDAHWLNVSFSGQPIAPGASSTPQSTVPASSDNTAYVALVPGWDGTSATPPTGFVLMQSRDGFAIALGDTLHIPVDDAHFEGNCASGSRLTSQQASFLAQIVFAGDLTGLAYDAATCTTAPGGDASGP